MARFRPVNTSPRDKERQVTRLRTKRAPAPDDVGQDPWTLPIDPRRNNACSSTVKPSSPVEATIKREVEEDDVALPISIGTAVRVQPGQPLGKIVTVDGKELPFYHEIPGFVYQPIPGFEHCFKAPDPAPTPEPLQGTQAPGKSIPLQLQTANERQPAHRVASRRGTVFRRTSIVPKPPSRENLKRRRSYATPDSIGGADNPVALVVDSDSDSDEGDRVLRFKLRPSCTFYIGDFAEVVKCLLRQFHDLSLRTVRTIVTAWIKHREPKRRKLYGSYHKKLPTEMPAESSPPWWPNDVQVNEPSHLCRDHVLKLAVDFLLLHREIDQIKRKSVWVHTLRKLATCTVELVPEDSFSASNNPIYDKEMRERATKHILPSIFDLAQSYEDHVIQYSLFEELDSADPGTGKQHTWQPAPTPLRRSNRSKRAIKREPIEVVKKEFDIETSGNETEQDDTLINTFLARKRVKGLKGVGSQRMAGAAGAVPPKAISSPEATGIPETINTPESASSTLSELHQHRSSATTSFDDPMDYFDLGDEMDLDIKGGSLTPHNNQALLRNMYMTSQPMQYSSSQPSYNHQSFLSQDNVNCFSQSFGDPSATSLANPFLVFNTCYRPQLHDPAFESTMLSNNAYSPHEYEDTFPLASLAGAGNESYFGLPNETLHRHPMDLNLN